MGNSNCCQCTDNALEERSIITEKSSFIDEPDNKNLHSRNISIVQEHKSSLKPTKNPNRLNDKYIKIGSPRDSVVHLTQ